MSQVSTLPMVYNQFPEIEFLNTLKDLDFGLDQTMPTIDELQGMAQTQRDNGGMMESGILESLIQIVKDSELDAKMVQRPEWTDDIVINKQIQNFIDDYYEKRIKNQATNICDHIDGLIRLDNYPKEMFGAYKKLHTIIDSTDDKFEMTRALNMLRITARSIVPPHVKYEQVQVLEPSILSSRRVDEG